MKKKLQHYINGEWIDSTATNIIDVTNPATEEVFGQIIDGTKEDLDKAVAAARAAFSAFSQTTREERIVLLQRITKEYEKRKDEIVTTVTNELGAPLTLSEKVHYNMGFNHFEQAAKELAAFEFAEDGGTAGSRKEPIGVCRLITRRHFPMNQTASKLATGCAEGCTVGLTPSELTPFSAIILAEVFEAAGV